MGVVGLRGVLAAVRGGDRDLGEALSSPAEVEVVQLRDAVERLTEANALMRMALEAIVADHRPYRSGMVLRCSRCPVGFDHETRHLLHDLWPCVPAQQAATALGVAL